MYINMYMGGGHPPFGKVWNYFFGGPFKNKFAKQKLVNKNL
jgi:hypothetical protein